MTEPRVIFAKADTALLAMSTYTVLLDGKPVGVVSKVRDRYLKRIGTGRGQNRPVVRDAWRHGGSTLHYDTRAEATVAVVAEALDVGYGTALDIVRGTA